ncbi:MAG: energy transducer TonB [Gemmatimonadota bacterium]|nr:energy transducer TonB [Gemmatimonadota bacterium]
MNIVHHRFSHSLLAQLARFRERQERFLRLLKDHPTGIRVAVRSKNPEADLKRDYGTRFLKSLGGSFLFMLVTVLVYPEHIPTVVLNESRIDVVQWAQIPETSQAKRPPPPPRPAVPIEVEGEEIPEDITIETTELNLDALPLDLRLRGPIATGPPSDAPMDEFDIEYKPHPIRIVAPEYPRQAHKQKLEGTVKVRVLVDKRGLVEKVEVVSGPEIFRNNAIAAARQFRFRPGKHEGEKRKVWMVMPIGFSLK